MNKIEVIMKVSEKSGINRSDCEKVLDAFEKVFENELSGSKNGMRALDKIYQVLSVFRTKTNSYKTTAN